MRFEAKKFIKKQVKKKEISIKIKKLPCNKNIQQYSGSNCNSSKLSNLQKKK